jgi:hypothetical protein
VPSPLPLKRRRALKGFPTEIQLLLFDSFRLSISDTHESILFKRDVNSQQLADRGWVPSGEQPTSCMRCYRSIERWKRPKNGGKAEFRYLDTELLSDHYCPVKGNDSIQTYFETQRDHGTADHQAGDDGWNGINPCKN